MTHQSEYLANTSDSVEAKGEPQAQGEIGFACHCSKTGERLTPVSNFRNPNRVITFDSHLKTFLLTPNGIFVFQYCSALLKLRSIAGRRYHKHWSTHPPGKKYTLHKLL